MTAQNPAIFLQAGSHPAEDVRRFIASGMRQGVVQNAAGTSLKVTEKSGTPNMSVDVAEGTAFIAGSQSSYQGTYFVDNRGVTNLTIAAANATNPRRDLIVAKVEDAFYSGATNAWSLAVVTGTAAASPSDPAVPSNAIVLARVTVAAAATSITNAEITDLRNTHSSNYGYAAALGGLIVCTSASRPASPVTGMEIFETDTSRRLIYSGTAWLLTHPIVIWVQDLILNQAGSTTFTVLNDNRNIFTAPCAGKLIVQYSGRGGFNANQTYVEVFINADNSVSTTAPDAVSRGLAAAAEWTALATARGADYASGANVGYSIVARSSITTGTTHVRGHITATFYPDQMA